MNYALVQDDQIVSTRLPIVGTLPDGSQVSGFDKLDPETLLEAGWFPIQDPGPPPFDLATQGVTERFEIVEGRVIIHYDVYDLPPALPSAEPEIDVFERIASLEAEVKGMKERAAAADVSNPDATRVRDAIVGPPR